MTVSWATPIASGSSPPAVVSGSAVAGADGSGIILLIRFAGTRALSGQGHQAYAGAIIKPFQAFRYRSA